MSNTHAWTRKNESFAFSSMDALERSSVGSLCACGKLQLCTDVAEHDSGVGVRYSCVSHGREMGS